MDLILPAHVRQEILRKNQAAQAPQLAPGRQGRFFRPSYLPSSSTGVGADWKPGDGPGFGLLRQIARRSVIDALIIDARRRQVKKIGRRAVMPGRDVGLRVVHKLHDDPAYEYDPQVRAMCQQIEAVLETVNPNHPVRQKRLKDVLAMWTEDELVIDRKVMILTRNVMGQIINFHYVDGATVLPRITVLYPWMEQNKIYDEQMAATALSYQWGIDISNATYIQEIDGQITAAWRDDEISVDIASPVGEIDHIHYGRSSLEKSLDLTRSFVNAWRYNQNLFDVRFPESVLILIGDYGAEELEDWRNQMTSGDTTQNQRIPVFSQPVDPSNPGQKFIESVKLRDSPREMQFPELLRMVIALKCAAYGMHPSTINFAPDGGGTAPMINNSDADGQIANAEEDGLGALMDNLTDWLTETVVRSYHPDLKVIVDGMDREGESTRVELMSARNWSSLQEIRARDDMLPYAVPEDAEVDDDMRQTLTLAATLPRDPGYLELLQVLLESQQQQQMLEQQQQQMMQQQQGPPGDFGSDGGQTGEDDWWQQQNAAPTKKPTPANDSSTTLRSAKGKPSGLPRKRRG